jgi:LuxR family transcriptional regulator, maltose regulon positive regulatory protein
VRKRGAGSAGGSARIRAGYQALGAGAWAKARREFEAALAAGETPEALEGLGRAAWWMDDAETVFRAREQAYRLYRRRGDKRSAARLAIALAEDSLYFRGEPAVAQGWHLRAGDLLQDLGPLTPEHGWLKLSEGDFALTFRGDPAASSSRAREAMEIGQSLGVEEIRILARALERRGPGG